MLNLVKLDSAAADDVRMGPESRQSPDMTREKAFARSKAC